MAKKAEKVTTTKKPGKVTTAKKPSGATAAKKPDPRDYLIIDAHNHLYETEEAAMLAHSMPYTFMPNFLPRSPGTIEGAMKEQDRANIKMSFLLPIMPTNMMHWWRVGQLPKDLTKVQREKAIKEIEDKIIARIKRQNRWSCEVGRTNKRFLPHVIADPIMGPDGIRNEIRECVLKLGAAGIGELVPGMLGTSIEGCHADDPSLDPIWDVACELGVWVFPHSGPSHPHPLTQKPLFNEIPEFYDNVLERFPKLKLMYIHMNFTGDNRWPELYDPSRIAGLAFCKRHPQVVCGCDSHLGYGEKTVDWVQDVKAAGVERCVWGSDFQYVHPYGEICEIINSSLTEKEKRMVLGENAVRIFNLKI